MTTFDDLITEGEAAPTDGWDFSWFEGRATEQRPSWGYARLLAQHLAEAEAALDLQTGGGEVLATAPLAPPTLVATEGWPPNLELARRNLAKFRAEVVSVEPMDDLPFDAGSFDFVTSRHPIAVRWDEIERVLRTGGTYLSQCIGAGTVRELSDYFLGPQPAGTSRTPFTAVTEAEAAGLTVVDLRVEALRMEFFDIAAVVHFLRKVIWIVPGFSVEKYREQLRELHEFIERHGPFVAYSQRFLIKAQTSPN